MTNSSKCCNDCFDEGVSQLSYGGCNNKECKCHTEKKAKVSERELLCLKALATIDFENEDGHCSYFRAIAKLSGLPEDQTRKAVRSLVRKGLAEYHRGLFDDDAMVAGSGHCISREGKRYMETL